MSEPINEIDIVTKNKTTIGKISFLFDYVLFLLFILSCISLVTLIFIPPSSFYSLSYSFWYLDFRYWSDWISWCCWSVLGFSAVSTLIAVFIPKNDKQLFLYRRSFYQKLIFLSCLITIGTIWYNFATLPLAVVFESVYSPVINFLDVNYSYPLADYYTTGEGSFPLTMPIISVTIFSLLFITWRVIVHVKIFKKSKKLLTEHLEQTKEIKTNGNTVTKNHIILILLLATIPLLLGATDTISTVKPPPPLSPPPPRKVSTSTGIYGIKSKDELDKFTAADIRQLIDIEHKRSGVRDWKIPHPILVYCFEEQTFRFTAGKYNNAEIKYRLHSPKKIDPNKKYPLVVHLHGVGEAGNDNTMQLVHLHSLLSLMVGPDQQDFFLLVTQCPKNDPSWTFSDKGDGNLDIAYSAIKHVINENPIDDNRISLFGLSSGGYGAWDFIRKYPEIFAACTPTACLPLEIYYPEKLKNTAIWTFCNIDDVRKDTSRIKQADKVLNGAGGYFKMTILKQKGHAVWHKAMDDYNCFSWMIAQQRGNWFNPPPERKIYKYRDLDNCFHVFLLPVLMSICLLITKEIYVTEFIHNKIAKLFYVAKKNKTQIKTNTIASEDNNNNDDYKTENKTVEIPKTVKINVTENIPLDQFRIWHDISGTKGVELKVISIKDDLVKFEDRNGKRYQFNIIRFYPPEQKLLREYAESK
ncbi:MAG: hypothetical protein LBE18_11030 [Planctomycetaceae bacterium]|jgi:predicted esterase|nr:hypothetical protein [Planctomycetaceae bacterium]